MAWLRSAVSKAVEVGNNNSLIRNVVNQAGQAVAEGAKLLQDRIGGKNVRSFKQAVKRLEEASISCRGRERAELMRRWVAVLKEIEKSSGYSSDGDNEQQKLPEDQKESPRRQSMVLYYDADMGGEPVNFRDLFLYSQALEGISICMILEAPNEDEVSLLLELFGLCLTGGKEVHNAIVSSIQDLTKTFSSYQDEVLVKREELLQFAEVAITGLKVNADAKRIEAEVSSLKKQLDQLRASHNDDKDGAETSIKESSVTTIEALKEALAQIRICTKIEGLLLKKKALSHGDTAEVRAQKVDKLKVLSESLANSSTKAEKRISENRVQKEEALKFRVSKSSEVSEIEKELTNEISGLEKQRDELEAQLKKINISLSSAQARLRDATEERDQFFKANDDIVAHLTTKEHELKRSVGSCRVEAGVLSAWISFLEDTWSLQSSYVGAKNKEMSAELEKHEDYFTNLVKQLLSCYEKELRPPIDRIGKYVKNLKNLTEGISSASNVEGSESQVLSPKRNLEEEYLDFESKIITTFSVVDNMREQFYAQQGKISRKEDPNIKELFENLEKLRSEFESIERPTLDIENPTKETEANPGEKLQEILASSTEQTAKEKKDDAKPHEKKQALETEEDDDDLSKLESEFGNVDRNYTSEEIGGWEFDELERDLKSSGDSSIK